MWNLWCGLYVIKMVRWHVLFEFHRQLPLDLYWQPKEQLRFTITRSIQDRYLAMNLELIQIKATNIFYIICSKYIHKTSNIFKIQKLNLNQKLKKKNLTSLGFALNSSHPLILYNLLLHCINRLKWQKHAKTYH